MSNSLPGKDQLQSWQCIRRQGLVCWTPYPTLRDEVHMKNLRLSTCMAMALLVTGTLLASCCWMTRTSTVYDITTRPQVTSNKHITVSVTSSTQCSDQLILALTIKNDSDYDLVFHINNHYWSDLSATVGDRQVVGEADASQNAAIKISAHTEGLLASTFNLSPEFPNGRYTWSLDLRLLGADHKLIDKLHLVGPTAVRAP